MRNNDIKQMIIENYIDWFTSDEDERTIMKMGAGVYVENDHVDEIEDYEREKSRNTKTSTPIELGKHPKTTDESFKTD